MRFCIITVDIILAAYMGKKIQALLWDKNL